jgi:cobalt-zinc-cadmium efflux system membrane fusion protein
MKKRKKMMIITAIFFLAVVAIIGFRNQGTSEVTSTKAAAADTEEQAGSGAAATEHGEEKSDLDRSVDEMWTAKCEHDILHYTCDECRYELGAVKLSPTVIAENEKPGLIKTTIVGTQPFSNILPLTGEVQLNETKTVHVSSPLPGIVRRTIVNIGQKVSAGDVLFEIDSPEVAEAKADYLKKIAVLQLARRTAEREANLFAKKISAEVEMQEAKTRQAEAEIELANTRTRLTRSGLSSKEIEMLGNSAANTVTGVIAVRAPRNGTILEGHLNTGEYVESGKELFVLSDLSEVWVWANLKESDALTLNPSGSKIPAEVSAQGTGGKKHQGTLDVISGMMHEQTRTVRARITVSNSEGLLRPGMFVNVKLLLPGGENVVAVPKVAVLADEGRTFVFVHKEADYWIRRPVALGETFGDQVIIRNGLTSGQKIIADGSFLLKSDVLRKKMGAGCAD